MIFPRSCQNHRLTVLLILAFLTLGSTVVFATDKSDTKVYEIAIKGYDPVAYFTENRPVKGTSAYTFKWNEAILIIARRLSPG